MPWQLQSCNNLQSSMLHKHHFSTRLTSYILEPYVGFVCFFVKQEIHLLCHVIDVCDPIVTNVSLISLQKISISTVVYHQQ